MDHPQASAPAGTPFPPGNCPLCGGGNQCAMVLEQATGQPQPPCWCTQAEFPPALLARVPAEAQRSACICSRCAALAAAAERADAARSLAPTVGTSCPPCPPEGPHFALGRPGGETT